MMVTLTVPTAASRDATKVNVLLVVAVAGSKETVTPLGRPEAAKVMLSLKPFCGVMLMVVDPLPPWEMLKLAGELAIVKPAGAETGQLFTKLAALKVPMPVAKSQPVLVP